MKHIEQLKSFRWAILILFIGCVEKINFDVAPASEQTVIEGTITTDPGPYTVRISRGLELDSDTSQLVGVEGAQITLFDDQGNEEDFVELGLGIYETTGLMEGQVGRAYHLEVRTADGKMFSSVPDTLQPVGEIEEMRYEYEARTTIEDPLVGEVPADVFNIYFDADAGEREGNFVRWRFTGTYKVMTNPELNIQWVQGGFIDLIPWADPLPCSGYVRKWENGGWVIEQRRESTCSTCWARQFEEAPVTADDRFVEGGKFQNVKLAEVPINPATFYEKYQIEIEQMSLSKTAFEFFNLVRDQKINATSLFQPPSSEIIGNFVSENPEDIVLGLFWATAVDKKTYFIDRDDVPYPLVPIERVTKACYDFYPNATTEQPEGWE